MTVYRFEGPDGRVHRAEANSPEEAKAGLEAMWAKQGAAPKKRGPTLPVIGDAMDGFAEAVENLKAGVHNDMEAIRGGKSPSAFQAPRLVGDALNLVAAPVTAAITRPLARATANLPMVSRPDFQDATAVFRGEKAKATRDLTREEKERDLEGVFSTALMGFAPAHGVKLPPPLPRPPKTAPGPAYAVKVARSSGATPESLRAAGASPRPRTAAEAAGKPAEVSLGALSRRPGKTADALTGAVTDRQLNRPARMLDDVAEAVGVSPEAATGNIEALVKAGRERAGPLYEEAYSVGAIDTEQLTALATRPSMRAAMARARSIAAEEGRNPIELGFEIKATPIDRTGPTPAREWMERQDLPDAMGYEAVTLRNPTAQTWDYVKRGVDDILNTYRDKTTGKLHLDEKGRAILGTLNQMREELINANPAYGRALAESGEYLSSERAFRDGGKWLFNGKYTERQFSERLGQMTAAEREAFNGGIANQFYNLAQNSKLDPKLLRTPRFRAKLEAALGPERADALIAGAIEEATMLAFERRYAPGANSVTAELKAAMAEQDATTPVGQIADDFVERGVTGAVRGMTRRALDKATAGIRTRGLDTAARDEAGELLMGSPDDLAAAMERFIQEEMARRNASRQRVGRVGAMLPPLLPTSALVERSRAN